jgi:hypothetical protein
MGLWTAKVVNRAATTVYSTIADVNMESAELTMPPTSPGLATFAAHPLDPNVFALKRPYLGGRREVQLWRDGKCRWWGIPLVGELVDAETVRFHCVHLRWWFGRRFFGPIFNNYLDPNSDFEAGLTGWTAVGTTAAVSSTWRAKGTQSVKLTQATAGTDTYLRRRYTITTTTQTVFLKARALLFIDAASWVGPALDERGLYLECQDSPGGALTAGVDPVWEPITESTPRDSPIPTLMEKGLTVPAGGTFTVEVRLYSPGGVVHYDDTALQAEESTGSPVTGEEAQLTFGRLPAYAQDPAIGKSDLHMAVAVETGAARSGVRIFQHFDNGQLLEAMDGFVSDGLLDWDVLWEADGSASHVHVWPAGRGTDVPGAVLHLPGNAVLDSGYTVDASSVVTKPRVIGNGTGATREVAEAVDTSTMDGHVVESVDTAPAESNTDAIWSRAAQILADNRIPGSTSALRLPASAVLDVFGLGDTVTPVIAYGWADDTDDHRVKRLTMYGADDTVLVGWS